LQYEITDDQILQERLVVIILALMIGVSISINPILVLEFTNDQSSGNNIPVFEEIDGDILDPTHPFQLENRFEELKKTIREGLVIVAHTENILEYITNLPEAGSGPENPDSSGNEFNNEPNNPPTENTQSNYGTDSQNPTLQNNPPIDVIITGDIVSVFEKVQVVKGALDEYSVERCAERGPEVELQHCNFVDANLYGTVLTAADLSDTDFTNANLQSAFLRDADLSGADLTGANLRYANLVGTNLEGANLLNTDFTGAKLSDRCLPDGKPMYFDLNGDNLNDVQLLEFRYYKNMFCVIYMR